MSVSLCIAVLLGLALETSSTPTESRQCRPGFFHNATADLCQGCPNGTYTNNYNLNSQCDRCSTCAGLHKLASACTASSDAVCRCPEGYYEHEDGCSPKPGANAEARLPDTPEWTWLEYFVITLTVLVSGIIGFAIFIIVHFPELRTKLLCCQRISSPVNDQPTIEQQRAELLDLKTEVRNMVRECREILDSRAPNQLTQPAGSERPHQPPNGSAVPVGSAANVPNNTAQPQVNSGLTAASASTIAHHPISLSSVATGGSADARTNGETAKTSDQLEVHLESQIASTPDKNNRLTHIKPVDSLEMVGIPLKASLGGLDMSNGNEVSPPAAPAQGTAEGRASAAGQVGAACAGIQRDVALHQGPTQKTVDKACGPLPKVYESGTLLSQTTQAGDSTPDRSEAIIAEDSRDTDPLISRVTADVGSTDAHGSTDKDVRRTSALQITD